MPQPRVSVILPFANDVAFLESSICSALDQQIPNLELIAVDLGSTDGSAALVRHYSDQMTLRQGASTQPAAAINDAIAASSGQIIGILPAGDHYAPFALDEVVMRFTAHQDVPHWVAGRCARIDEQDGPMGMIDTDSVDLPQLLLHEVEARPLASVFYTRRVLEMHGRFDASLHQAYAYEHQCRLLALGLTPRRVAATVAHHRERDIAPTAEATLLAGLEMIEVAQRYADALHLSDRADLWRSCDERRRIYALAAAELDAQHARRRLLPQVLRHPWWLADPQLRRRLLHNGGPLRDAA